MGDIVPNTAMNPSNVGSILSNVPVFGGILSSVGNLISGIGKSATKHLSYDQARPVALQYGVDLQNFTLINYTADQYAKINTLFRSKMIAFLQSCLPGGSNERWGGGIKDGGAYTTDVIAHLQLANIPVTIQATFTGWGVWVLQNMDAESTTEFASLYGNDMQVTFCRTVNTITGQPSTAVWQALTVSGSTAKQGTPASTPAPVTTSSLVGTPSTTPATAGFDFSSPIGIFVILGIVGAVIYAMTKGKK